MRRYTRHDDDSRKRAGEISRKQAQGHRASDDFDWDAAIARFKVMLEQIYGKRQ